MRSRGVLGALVAGLLLTGCGDSGDDGGQDGVDIPFAPIAKLEDAETCVGASSAEDPRGDSDSPVRDLVRLELRSTRAGLCVRWTTDAQALVGTKLFLGARGPSQKTPAGSVVSYGYGFFVELTPDGAEVTFGLADPVNDTPNVLDARVGQSGRTVSAFVPRRELDRPPANMPDRPPFPYEEFIVESRVLDATEDIADSWPDDPESQAAYVAGKLCGPPCTEAPRLFEIPKPG
jgi:hypothetical protein